MTRAVVGLWTLLIVYGLLLFGDYLGQAVDNFRRNTAQADRLSSANNLKSVFHARSIAMKEQQRAA